MKDGFKTLVLVKTRSGLSAVPGYVAKCNLKAIAMFLSPVICMQDGMVRIWNSEAGSNVYWLARRHKNTGLNIAKVRNRIMNVYLFTFPV